MLTVSQIAGQLSPVIQAWDLLLDETTIVEIAAPEVGEE